MATQDVLFQSLEEQGWAISDRIVLPALTQALYNHAHQLWQQGFFKPASVGRNAGLVHDPDVRGDAICWLDEKSPAAPIVEFQAWAHQLRQDLNRHFFLSLRSQEFHFARYEPGHGYARHVDQHIGSGARKISLVLYLNEDWEAGDGGELCLYDAEPTIGPEQESTPAPASDTTSAPTHEAPPLPAEASAAKLLPQAGRLVLFRSDTIPHEVLPARRVRWSLTGWYRDDDQI
ncbi:2OG-Fe(II) oxygenase [Pusillimonas sp.]|uniref:2OG-Fe(II) oxygenase n=1 Tax=Pusillimonas sp. TaxID=3040095 RepID=UPI0037CBBBB0